MQAGRTDLNTGYLCSGSTETWALVFKDYCAVLLCAVLLKACDDSVLFNPSQVEQWMKNFCFFSNIRNHAHSYAAKNEGP